MTTTRVRVSPETILDRNILEPIETADRLVRPPVDDAIWPTLSRIDHIMKCRGLTGAGAEQTNLPEMKWRSLRDGEIPEMEPSALLSQLPWLPVTVGKDSLANDARPETVVTLEMIKAGHNAYGPVFDGTREAYTAIYRAMDALAPPISHGRYPDDVIVLRRERDEAVASAHQYKMQRDDAIAAASRLFELVTARSEPGDHPYNGPSAPDSTGTRRSIPDAAHERFHQSVGDVLAGKIMPKAREQMRDALNQPVPAAPTDASTSKPMPGKALGGMPADVGMRLP